MPLYFIILFTPPVELAFNEWQVLRRQLLGRNKRLSDGFQRLWNI